MKKYLTCILLLVAAVLLFPPDVLGIKDTLPPNPPYYQECNGDVNTHGKTITVKDMPDDPKVRSNLDTIYIQTDKSENYRFEYDKFIPGFSSETKWWLTVIDRTMDAKAVITFTDKAGNDTTLFIYYSLNKLAIHPKITKLGKVGKGVTIVKDLWLVNESTQSEHDAQYLFFKSYWRGQKSSFDIPSINGKQFWLPVRIPAMDSIPFKVRFSADSIGIYKDSIGVGDTNSFYYKAYVEAEVGEPIIKVTDWNFGDTKAGSGQAGEITIKNEGNVDLIIKGYSGPTLSAYTPQWDLSEVNLNNTDSLVIPPFSNNTRSFEVHFKPTANEEYIDSIVIISNSLSDKSDSVALLTGRGIKAVAVVDDLSDNLYLNIFPNPAKDIIDIIVGAKVRSPLQDCDIQVYNILGECIKKTHPSPTQVEVVRIDVSDLPPGLYYCSVSAGSKKIVKRFVVVR